MLEVDRWQLSQEMVFIISKNKLLANTLFFMGIDISFRDKKMVANMLVVLSILDIGLPYDIRVNGLWDLKQWNSY